MRLLFIGGSNFFIKGSVVETVPVYLADALGQEVVEVQNIAVPGTGSMYGLHNYLLLDEPDRFDFVFIEYGINDYSLYNKNPDLWDETFGSLIRTVRKRSPGALIVVILFGRRNEQFHTKQHTMHSRMCGIAGLAGAVLVDADSLFKELRGLEFKSIYVDDAHYKTPLVTNFLSVFTVFKILGILQRRGKPSRIDAGSREFCAWDFMPVDFSNGLSGRHPLTTFANSRYSKDALCLARGEELDVTTDGLPVGIALVSHRTTGSILIDINGKKSIIHCLNKRVWSGEFKFLLRYFPFYWLSSREDYRQDKTFRLRMRLIDADDPEWTEDVVKPNWGMIARRPGGAKAAYLLGVTTMRR